jgi:hypothetical protein
MIIGSTASVRVRDAELEYLFSSDTAQRLLAENHVGLPFWRCQRIARLF